MSNVLCEMNLCEVIICQILLIQLYRLSKKVLLAKMSEVLRLNLKTEDILEGKIKGIKSSHFCLQASFSNKSRVFLK